MTDGAYATVDTTIRTIMEQRPNYSIKNSVECVCILDTFGAMLVLLRFGGRTIKTLKKIRFFANIDPNNTLFAQIQSNFIRKLYKAPWPSRRRDLTRLKTKTLSHSLPIRQRVIIESHNT